MRWWPRRSALDEHARRGTRSLLGVDDRSAIVVVATKYTQIAPAFGTPRRRGAWHAGRRARREAASCGGGWPYAQAAAGARNVRVAPAGVPLGALIAVAAVLVTVNSTAAIEAMPLGVPALVVGLPNNLSPFVDLGAMAGAASTEAIEPALRGLLYDQEMRGRLAAARGAFLRPLRHPRRRRSRTASRRGHSRDLRDTEFVRAFITGGAGFIGSHLAEALLASGHEVSILDDLSTGSIHNIEHLKGRPGFRYAIDSVTNEPLLAELVDDCDVVFHLAAAVGVKLIVEAPVHTIETNVHGTEVVLKHANKKKKLVVLASTSEVYGKSISVPFKEDDDLVLGPTPKHRWAYACSKAIDEFLALAYWKEKKLPVIIARFFNTVGPRQTGRYGMVIPNFVRQGLSGQTITVHGDGTQTASFCHVGDVVDALGRLVEEPRAVGEVFNIGNDQEITIMALAEKVRVLTGSRSSIAIIPVRSGLRGRIRGHAAAGSRPEQDSRAHRLRARSRISTRSSPP